jgi:folate-binding protein YgfZ
MTLPNAPVRVDLSHNALIAIAGDDARLFLHAQLTNDVEALRAGDAQWNGWCSPKGRLLATFLLFLRQHEYLAMLPAEIAPAIAKRLAMFVLRSKVRIRDATAEFARCGVTGAGAAQAVQALGEHGDILVKGIGPEAFVVIAPAGHPGFAKWQQTLRVAGREAWDLALIRAGVPTVVAATQDAFVPQMANFELVGGVSFKKGCYPGQEIVARTQYRGILKRRMALAHVDAAEAPAPGQNVYSAAFGDQATGTVVSAAPVPGGGYDFLVVAQIDSLRKGGLHLGSPDGAPIEIRSQPAAEAAS